MVGHVPQGYGWHLIFVTKKLAVYSAAVLMQLRIIAVFAP